MKKSELIEALTARIETMAQVIGPEIHTSELAEWLINAGYVTEETMFEKEKEYKETGI